MIERYLELGLRLGRHVDGLVDAYYGPAELREQADEGEPRPPADLRAEATELLGALDAIEDEQRRRWVRAQLVGLETLSRRLSGESIAYADEVERCYGVRPQLVPEEVFQEALDELDRALPGDGPLYDRYQAWLATQIVPREHLSEAIALLKEDLRERTRRIVDLPEGEDVETELVSDEPWAGFNYYLGARRSRSVLNTDLPTRAFVLPELVAHEMYPGHHTEHVCKEVLLVEGRGWLEETILLVTTPQSLVSEGIAMLALETAVPEDPDAWAAGILSPLGIPYDVEISRIVRCTSEVLRGVSANNALLLHEHGASLEESRAYVRRWALASEERVEKTIQFATDPTWRSYVGTYTAGVWLCRAFVAGDVSRFRRLLTEQLTPADLQDAVPAPPAR